GPAVEFELELEGGVGAYAISYIGFTSHRYGPILDSGINSNDFQKIINDLNNPEGHFSRLRSLKS
ncbi:MAG: hypothetical protein NZM26_03830, partial [Patescibacteria group bacterium]|nr:hypothetical protein [Patescibacteria group bacterium]